MNPLKKLAAMTNSIFSPINRARTQVIDGALDGEEHALQILPSDSTKDKELLELSQTWMDSYNNYQSKITNRQEANYKYWKGTQQPMYTENVDTRRRVASNMIFEATETFLPAATKNNPECYATIEDESEEAQRYTSLLKDLLNQQGKRHGLKFKIRDATRGWLFDLIGVIGISWSMALDDFEVQKIEAKRMIFDVEGYIDWDGSFQGRYLGYIRTMQASRIKKLFKDSAQFVDQQTANNDGTNVDVIEWWTPDLVFFTDVNTKVVFGSMRYPHWNYDNTEIKMDDYEVEYEDTQIGYNYLKKREFPFLFITQLTTGRAIHDETSLIEQCMPPQDILTKRTAQADFNADMMNNGFTVSGEYFQKEQAAEFARALAEGDVAFIPQKQLDNTQYDIQQAYKREQAAGLPVDIYNQMATAKMDIRSIFGTFGLTPETQQGDTTVRGKMLAQQSDSSRIGGGIVEILETVSATLYTWMLQMMYVYYDTQDYSKVLGREKAQELLQLQQQYLSICPSIYVREGSLLAKSPIVQRNEAIDLFQMGVLDPLTLYEKLDFADPAKTLQRLVTYQMQPTALLGLAGGDGLLAMAQAPGTEPGVGTGTGLPPEHSGGGNDAYPSSMPQMDPNQSQSLGSNNL